MSSSYTLANPYPQRIPQYIRSPQFPSYPIILPSYGLQRLGHFNSLRSEPSPLPKDKIQHPASVNSGLTHLEYNILNYFIKTNRPQWNALAPGSFLRLDKTLCKLPRTIEVFKGNDNHMHIMVLCKTKVSTLLNPQAYLIQKDPKRILGFGSYKIVKYALDWDQNKLCANLVIHPANEEIHNGIYANLKEAIKIANKFAGKRGFPSLCIGTHEYTKIGRNGLPILKLGFFMPYAPLGDLWTYCTDFNHAKEDIPMDRNNRLGYLLDIASALKAMKAMNIVHNDIKPFNFLINRDDNGQVHLECIDFDFAYDAAKENRNALGTHDYEAPENIFRFRTHNKPNRFRGSISPFPHDMWSAGITYCKLLAAKNNSLFRSIDEFCYRRVMEIQKKSDILTFTQNRDSYFKSINDEVDNMLASIAREYIGKDATFELYLLKRMLEANPDKRISPDELFVYLQ